MSEDPLTAASTLQSRPWALGRAAIRPPRSRRGPRRIPRLRSARGPSVGPGARWMTCASSSPAPPGTDPRCPRPVSAALPGLGRLASSPHDLHLDPALPASTAGPAGGHWWALARLTSLPAPPAPLPASGSSEPDQRPREDLAWSPVLATLAWVPRERGTSQPR